MVLKAMFVIINIAEVFSNCKLTFNTMKNDGKCSLCLGIFFFCIRKRMAKSLIYVVLKVSHMKSPHKMLTSAECMNNVVRDKHGLK